MAGEVVDGFFVDTGAQLFSTAYTVALQICEELGVPFGRSPVNPLGAVYNGSKGKFGMMDPSSMVNLTTIRTLFSFTIFSPKALWQFQKFARFMLRRRKDFTTTDHLRVLDLDFEGTFADQMVMPAATCTMEDENGGVPDRTGGILGGMRATF